MSEAVGIKKNFIYFRRGVADQIKLRANRMGSFTDHMLLLCETNLDTIRTAIERQNPELVIIDSIQTMYNEEVSSAPGSVRR